MEDGDDMYNFRIIRLIVQFTDVNIRSTKGHLRPLKKRRPRQETECDTKLEDFPDYN